MLSRSEPSGTLELRPGETRILQFQRLHRAWLVDEEVAEARQFSTRELVVIAKQPGTTNLLVWADAGQFAFRVRVAMPRPGAGALHSAESR